MTIEIPVALYRLYDEEGTLLYVGITESLGTRMMRHAASQHWWDEASRLTVEMLPDRPAAEAAETAAIRAELPIHNKAKNPSAVRSPRTIKAVELVDGRPSCLYDRRSMIQKIAAELRSDIMAGLIPDGAKLPTLPHVAKGWGVPVSTVQRAWSVLQHEGYIVGKRGVNVIARAQLNSGTSAEDVVQLKEVAEVDPPSRVVHLLGEEKAVMRCHLRLRQGQPVEVGRSYYPASIAADTALAQQANIRDVHTLLAELGHPVRKSADRLAIRPPTTEEIGLLDIADSVPVWQQVRTYRSNADRPVEVSVLIKPGHLHELEYQQAVSE